MCVPGSGKVTFRAPRLATTKMRRERRPASRPIFSARRDLAYDEVVGLGRSQVEVPDGRQAESVALGGQEAWHCECLAHGRTRRSFVDSDGSNAGERAVARRD